MKRSATLLLGAGLLVSAMHTNAATIDFESMGLPGRTNPHPGGFNINGFNFSSNMDVVDVSSSGGWWSNGVGVNHSGNYAALNDWGGPMLMTQVGGGTFSVDSLLLNGWQGASYTTTIEGLRNGSIIGSTVLRIGSPWLLANLKFSGIDTLRISGGTFLVDDISVGEVPIPAAVWLFGPGLMGLLGFCRRKQGQAVAA